MSYFWQTHERQVTVVYTVLCLVFPRSEGVKYFTVRDGQRNLTLKVNETLKLYFSFNETLEDNRNVTVYVQHRPLVADAFNTKCILKPSRHNCSSSSGLCRCLRWNVGNYSFQKIVEKKDSGTWHFQFWDKGGESTYTLYIIAKENDDREKTNNSTITTVTSTTKIVITACTGTVVIIFFNIVVVCCCCWRRRKAARAAGTGPDGNIRVATRSGSGRWKRQGDSLAYTSPASVMTLREYAGIMTPQQLQQQMDIYSESASNDPIYGNTSSPVKQNRWKLGQRCSRLARRFLPLTTFPNSGVKDDCERCPQASTDEDVGVYNNPPEDAIYANCPGVSKSCDVK